MNYLVQSLWNFLHCSWLYKVSRFISSKIQNVALFRWLHLTFYLVCFVSSQFWNTLQASVTGWHSFYSLLLKVYTWNVIPNFQVMWHETFEHISQSWKYVKSLEQGNRLAALKICQWVNKIKNLFKLYAVNK